MKQEIYPTTTNSLDLVSALKLEHKVQDICLEMESAGFILDVAECERQIDMLETRIQWVDQAILPLIPPKPKPVGTTINKVYKINGDYTKQTESWLSEVYSAVNSKDYNKCLEVVGSFNRIEFVPINLDSSKQVNEWLLANGWKPKVWNYQKDKSGKELKDYYGNKIKTSPKITEDSFQDLEELGAAGALIAYRRKCTHKRNQIQGFLRHKRKDGTIPSVVNTIGAATGRMTHSIVANVPAPKQKAFWKWMRKVFSAPKGYLVVGADADQCQVRALAHYMNSEEFISYLLDPNIDLHSVNAERAGVTRSHAKSVFYGYLFGAGANKTASQIGCTVQKAEVIRKKFEVAVPEIPKLIAALKKFWNKNGYILGIDGRKIYVPYEHMLLVYLLQNFEAVLMKWAMVLADEAIKERGLDARFATFQHDEFQMIVREDQAKEVAEILEDSINKAGTILGSRCIIKGKADIGNTWYDTH